MLNRARLGLFEPHRVGTVPAALRNRYLRRMHSDSGPMLQVTPELRKLIRYARLNLMSPTFPFRYGFHVIFCRNVMIYFNNETRSEVVRKIVDLLRPGGYVFVSHSESLVGIHPQLTMVKPSIFIKL